MIVTFLPGRSLESTIRVAIPTFCGEKSPMGRRWHAQCCPWGWAVCSTGSSLDHLCKQGRGSGVKINDTKGSVRAPEVVASVIYADEIKANSVSADTIYVRELRKR